LPNKHFEKIIQLTEIPAKFFLRKTSVGLFPARNSLLERRTGRAEIFFSK
jgi:hypothetical protein